jgi:hypothetical protein
MGMPAGRIVRFEAKTRETLMQRPVVFQIVFAAILLGAQAADARTYSEFRKAYERGADCPELFRIRNQMDPKSKDKERANADMRLVGCYHDQAKRMK